MSKKAYEIFFERKKSKEMKALKDYEDFLALVKEAVTITNERTTKYSEDYSRLGFISNVCFSDSLREQAHIEVISDGWFRTWDYTWVYLRRYAITPKNNYTNVNPILLSIEYIVESLSLDLENGSIEFGKGVYIDKKVELYFSKLEEQLKYRREGRPQIIHDCETSILPKFDLDDLDTFIKPYMDNYVRYILSCDEEDDCNLNLNAIKGYMENVKDKINEYHGDSTYLIDSIVDLKVFEYLYSFCLDSKEREISEDIFDGRINLRIKLTKEKITNKKVQLEDFDSGISVALNNYPYTKYSIECKTIYKNTGERILSDKCYTNIDCDCTMTLEEALSKLKDNK